MSDGWGRDEIGDREFNQEATVVEYLGSDGIRLSMMAVKWEMSRRNVSWSQTPQDLLANWM